MVPLVGRLQFGLAQAGSLEARPVLGLDPGFSVGPAGAVLTRWPLLAGTWQVNPHECHAGVTLVGLVDLRLGCLGIGGGQEATLVWSGAGICTLTLLPSP